MTRKKTFIEITLALTFIFLYWLLYNPVGKLTSERNLNFASYLITGLDRLIPYVAFPVFAYHSAFWVVPLFMVGTVVYIRDKREDIYAIVTSLFSIITISYAIYLIFPVSIIFYKGVPPEINMTGLANEWVRASYRTICPWNSFPSMHIATAWLTLRILRRYVDKLWLSAIYIVWFVMMSAGTVTLQYHSILDGIAGLVIVEIVLRVFLFYKRNLCQFYDKIKYGIRVFILCVGSVVLICALNILRTSGHFISTI